MEMQFKPEALYERTNLDEVEIIPFETAVVGTVIRYDSSRKQIIVDLGNSWIGIIPEDKITVYEFEYPEGKNIPRQITGIIDCQIRAIVTEVKENKILILSRTLSMMQAWFALKEDTIVNAYITKNIGHGIFFDLGNGLVSFNSRQKCMAVKKSDTMLWFSVGDIIKVKLLTKGEYPGSEITSSHSLVFPSINDIDWINVGDIVTVRIALRLNEEGFWCQYNPRISGIIDTDQELHEGQVVKAIVKAKIKDKGFKLRQLL